MPITKHKTNIAIGRKDFALVVYSNKPYELFVPNCKSVDRKSITSVIIACRNVEKIFSSFLISQSKKSHAKSKSNRASKRSK